MILHFLEFEFKFAKKMSLSDLPEPVINIITSYLKVADRARFARTCKRHLVFMPGIKDLLKIRQKEKDIFNHFKSEVDFNFCRICYEITNELSYCEQCHEYGICDECTNNNCICIICTDSKRCYICGGEDVITCFGCKNFVCFKHLIEYCAVDIYYCDNCRD